MYLMHFKFKCGEIKTRCHSLTVALLSSHSRGAHLGRSRSPNLAQNFADFSKISSHFVITCRLDERPLCTADRVNGLDGGGRSAETGQSTQERQRRKLTSARCGQLPHRENHHQVLRQKLNVLTRSPVLVTEINCV